MLYVRLMSWLLYWTISKFTRKSLEWRHLTSFWCLYSSLWPHLAQNWAYPGNIYLNKVNNKCTRKSCEICSKLTMKTPEQRHWLLNLAWCEKPIWSCAWQNWIFKNCVPKIGKIGQIQEKFEFLGLYRKFIIAIFQQEYHFWEKSSSWDISRNVFDQSNCRIFKSTKSPEQYDETALFFTCLYKFIKVTIWY